MKRVSLFLTEAQIAALQQLSQITGLKFAELVRRFIDAGLVGRVETPSWLSKQRS